MIVMCFVLLYVVSFFAGGTFASALCCAVYRIKHGESWIHGRSHCDNCGAILHWYELIPVFSALFLKFSCHNCHNVVKSGWIYTLVEFVFGVMFSILTSFILFS